MARPGRTVITPAMIARSRSVADPRWSPDGTLLAWVESSGGRADLLVAPTDGSGLPAVVTAEQAVTPIAALGSGAFTWAGDDLLVYAAADGSLLTVSPRGGSPRALADDGRVAAPSSPPGGVVIAFVVETDDECGVATVPADGSADPVVISTGADYAWDPTWSPDASLVAWHEWDLGRMSWHASRIVVAAADGTSHKIVAGGSEVSVGQPRFSPDGSRLAYVSDEHGWWNVWTCAPDGADATPVLREACEHAEPAWGPGQRSFAWSPDGRRIALNRNEAGFGRLVVVDLEGDGRVQGISKGWHHGLDWATPGIVCVRSGARTAPAVTVVDPGPIESGPIESGPIGESSRRVIARGAVAGFEEAGLVEPEVVQWTASDGETVHGLLYRPTALEPGALEPGDAPPLLVEMHGGPTGQAVVSWRPLRQLFVNRGWAVLTPNARGSTGYGRTYAQALAGQWGVLDVDDIATGIRTAGARGWCDPARVAMIGSSAGGFAVLLVCAQHGDLVRAGVSMSGVTDLLDLAATTHRFESRYLDHLVGELPRDEARYRERSPITQAAKIRVPLLVLQGDADKVVPLAQASQLVEAVGASSDLVEHHVYEGEGHGWSRPETVIDAYERVETFLRRHVMEG